MEKLLEVKNLRKHFEIKSSKLIGESSWLKAVDDVSFDVNREEVLGIVGESGCGKSTLGKTIMRLYDKTDGSVLFKDRDVFELDPRGVKEMRRTMQMVFQDPFSSLNPRKRIESLLAQPLRIHNMGSRMEISRRVDELLDEVGLTTRYRRRYPHQFSGGQRQRIGLARAVALNPELVICDEAVSALDVSIQAQVLNLLKDLQEKYHLTYIFIAHDLSVVEFISDRILVMYLGRIVELADKQVIVENHLHPYTKALFEASPGIDPRKDRGKRVLLGDVPSPINPPRGCHFHPRCPDCMDICREVYPPAVEVEPGHWVACHLYPGKK